MVFLWSSPCGKIAETHLTLVDDFSTCWLLQTKHSSAFQKPTLRSHHTNSRIT